MLEDISKDTSREIDKLFAKIFCVAIFGNPVFIEKYFFNRRSSELVVLDFFMQAVRLCILN